MTIQYPTIEYHTGEAQKWYGTTILVSVLTNLFIGAALDLGLQNVSDGGEMVGFEILI